MQIFLSLVEVSSKRVNLELFFLECGEKRCLLFDLCMCLLRLLFGFETHFVHIVLQALGLELELVVLSLQHSLGRSFFFNFFGMLDQQVVFIHLCHIPLFAYF